MIDTAASQRPARHATSWLSRWSRVTGALFVVMACLSLACGGGPTSPSGSGGSGTGSSGGSGSGGSGSGTGTIRAFIDGVTYTGTVSAASFRNGTLTIASSDAAVNSAINLTLSNAAVGVYPVNGTTPLTMQVTTLSGTTVTGTWSASATGGSGSLLLNTLSTVAATGTFTFVAGPSGPGAAGSKSVTSGAFSVFF